MLVVSEVTSFHFLLYTQHVEPKNGDLDAPMTVVYATMAEFVMRYLVNVYVHLDLVGPTVKQVSMSRKSHKNKFLFEICRVP